MYFRCFTFSQLSVVCSYCLSMRSVFVDYRYYVLSMYFVYVLIMFMCRDYIWLCVDTVFMCRECFCVEPVSSVVLVPVRVIWNVITFEFDVEQGFPLLV